MPRPRRQRTFAPKKTTYLGNSSIKKDGVVENWTPETIEEYKNCMNDPIYFIEKYVKIINLDRGMETIQLYPFQRNLINHMNDNQYSIILSARQTGKCVASSTEVKLRKKDTGEEVKMSIGELYEISKKHTL